MEFLLRIFITGLVALVPGDDGKSLTALLQVTPDDPSMRHVPVVLYECKNGPCGGQISQPLGTELQFYSGSRPPFDGVLLMGDEVSLSGAKAGSITFVQGLRTHRWYHDWIGSRPASPSGTKDLSWVPSMSHISQQAGTVAPRHLHKPDRAEIAGVLRLDGIEGAVRVFSLTEIDKKVPSLTFKKHGRMQLRGCKQALADTVLVEIEVAAPYVTFEFTSFGDSRPRSRISLIPAPKETTVDVLVGNLFVPCGKPPDVLAGHFDMYYDLASKQVNERLIPERGMRSVAASTVASDEDPPILTEWNRCPRDVWFLGALPLKLYIFAGFQKPICTLASFDSP